jgi:hypothetical protein
MNQWFWQVHGPLLELLALPVMLDDSLARQLRRQTWKAVAALAIVAAAVYPWVLPGLAPAALTSYLALLLAISLGHWQRVREFGPLGGAIVTLAASALGPGRYGYQWLDQSPIGRGLPWLVAGLAAVVVALTISLLKMGLWPWLRRMAVQFRLVSVAPENGKL